MIKNRAELERKHGKSAKIVLGAIEAAIKSVEPGTLVKRAVKTKKGSITFSDIYEKSLTIRNFKDIYVVGAGKAAAPMAAALSQRLKGGVAGGAINVPRGSRVTTIKGISITYASHPVPDESGVNGTKEIVRVVEEADTNDVVIMLISGGGSALLPLPADGISLSDKQKVTKSLLASGASIHEINTVRKHLSAVKGGQLLRHARCRVVISLVLSDVVGDDFAVIASGPTTPDPTTYSDALEIVTKYRIGNSKITDHLERGLAGEIAETLKPNNPLFGKVRNFLIGNNNVACKSAARYLGRQVATVKNLGSEFDGEAQDFGRFVAKVAARRHGHFAVVAGGETTVTLGNTGGKGGRNQEAALAYALAFNNNVDTTTAFVGTDGIDGNTDAAGAIISERSAKAASTMDAKRYLLGHDSYLALKKMDSLIFTGYTGTNVNDIAISLSLKDS